MIDFFDGPPATDFGAYSEASILVLDPATNVTDRTALGGLSTTSAKYEGIAFAPNVGKLFQAPYRMRAVLIADPVNNVTDDSAITTGTNSWAGIVYAEITGESPPFDDCFFFS